MCKLSMKWGTWRGALWKFWERNSEQNAHEAENLWWLWILQDSVHHDSSLCSTCSTTLVAFQVCRYFMHISCLAWHKSSLKRDFWKLGTFGHSWSWSFYFSWLFFLHSWSSLNYASWHSPLFSLKHKILSDGCEMHSHWRYKRRIRIINC